MGTCFLKGPQRVYAMTRDVNSRNWCMSDAMGVQANELQQFARSYYGRSSEQGRVIRVAKDEHVVYESRDLPPSQQQVVIYRDRLPQQEIDGYGNLHDMAAVRDRTPYDTFGSIPSVGYVRMVVRAGDEAGCVLMLVTSQDLNSKPVQSWLVAPDSMAPCEALRLVQTEARNVYGIDVFRNCNLADGGAPPSMLMAEPPTIQLFSR